MSKVLCSVREGGIYNMLTPLDIENREFKRTMSGYNRDDVEDFMGILLNDYENLYKSYFYMREKIAGLESEIARLQSEPAIACVPESDEVSGTSGDGEAIVCEAQLKAEKLVEDARTRANAIIKEANEEIDKLNKCYAESRQKMLDYREYMKTFLEAQLKVVEGIVEPGNE